MRNTDYSYTNGYAVGALGESKFAGRYREHFHVWIPTKITRAYVCSVDGSGGGNRRFYTSDHETNVHLTKVITSLQKDLEKVVSSVGVIEQRINQSLEKVNEDSYAV